MQDELKSRLIKYLDHLEEVGKQGADFVAGQAPDTVRQFIQWEIVSSIAAGCACLAVAAFLGFVIYKIHSFEFMPESVPAYVFTGLGFIGCLCGAYTHFGYALKAYIAPNVFLIEKAAELLKNTR
jgi:hypothetical protein